MGSRTFRVLCAASFIFFVGGVVPGSSEAKVDRCLECHAEIESSPNDPSQKIRHDVHFQRGLSCADCHGGDPEAADMDEAKDPAKGFIGKPAKKDIPQFCARCHADPDAMRRYNPNLPTDQYAKYLSSRHGIRNLENDPNTAVCIDCHGVHGILSKTDSRSPVFPTNIPGTCAVCHSDEKVMGPAGLPVTQHWEYSQGVHGQALLFKGDRGAPHCASCHGSHEAAKPKTIAVGNICAQCHALSRDLFAKSPHKAAHEKMGLPECEVCHGNHRIEKPTDEMLGTGPKAVCIECHKPGSKGFDTAKEMREGLDTLNTRWMEAKAKVAEADYLGMDVGEAEFALSEARSRLTQARAYVHSFSVNTMQPILEEGTTSAKAAAQIGQDAIRKFYFRREGLWVTLGIIGLLILGLFLKLRDVERQGRDNKPTE
jgi:hypothetical protein